MVRLSSLKTGTARGRGEITSVSRFCTTMLTPSAVRRPVVVGEWRTGRKATRSNTTATSAPVAMAMGAMSQGEPMPIMHG